MRNEHKDSLFWKNRYPTISLFIPLFVQTFPLFLKYNNTSFQLAKGSAGAAAATDPNASAEEKKREVQEGEKKKRKANG